MIARFRRLAISDFGLANKPVGAVLSVLLASTEAGMAVKRTDASLAGVKLKLLGIKRMPSRKGNIVWRRNLLTMC